MIKLYGSKMSSAGRCYWALEEAGVPYEEVPLDFKANEHKSAEYLKLNPNGKVPTMTDGDLVLWESLAINRYIATKYKPELLGADEKLRALVDQWSLWALIHAQRGCEAVYIEEYHGNKDQAVIAKGREDVKKHYAVLEQYLVGKDYMVGSSFTLADIAIASVVAFGVWVGCPTTDFPNLDRFMQSIMARPAWKKSQG